MNINETEIRNMTAAFKLWEEEFRANPKGFMDKAAVLAKTPGDLGELRAIYFAELLNRLRDEGVITA